MQFRQRYFPRISQRGFRCLQLALLAVAVALSTGAGDATGRYNKLSHQIMCPCGCNELLGECNHVGCPDSDAMRGKLMTAVNHGDADREILINFQNDYGPTALASPRFTPFNRVAWIMPPFVLILGLVLIGFTVKRWRLRAAPVPAPPAQFSGSDFHEVRSRIRRETEL